MEKKRQMHTTKQGELENTTAKLTEYITHKIKEMNKPKGPLIRTHEHEEKNP